ncbi:MAG: acylphosphatase, partial [Gammaproteobacteria bacterium]|nr:acylphosphatase [Gammaproteobacteria bacterium]
MTTSEYIVAETIRVYGTVQGVGFRPTVWRLARVHKLTGSVWNDALGVGIRVWGGARQLEAFIGSLQRECPPLARIERIERSPMVIGRIPDAFEIYSSVTGETQTNVA